MSGVTNIDRALMAAASLASAGHTTFSAEQLTVTAWQAAPGFFGITGYETDYPDHHKTMSILSGPRGIVGRGWLARVGRGKYRLTPDGLAEIARATNSNFGRRRARLSADATRHLDFLLKTTAWGRWRQGRTDTIGPVEAEIFLMAGDLPGLIGQLEEATSTGPIRLANGMEVDASMARMLRDCEAALGRLFYRKLGAKA